MEQESLKSILESLLFISSKPVKLKELADFLQQDKTLIKNVMEELVLEKKNCGVIILDNSEEYQLATNSQNSTLVKNFLNAELREKLTDATVEVLAIVAYRQPISKSEIEAIRGVNSQYSLRTLLMRGLVEKTPNPRDARSFLYQTTTEFLQHLGLSAVKDLPEFEQLVSQIKLPQAPQLEIQTESSKQDQIQNQSAQAFPDSNSDA
jgi:segregation and condensation protein B